MVLNEKQFAASAGHGNHDSRTAAQTFFLVYIMMFFSQTPIFLCRQLQSMTGLFLQSAVAAGTCAHEDCC